MNRSSPVPAVVIQPQTTMLYCRQGSFRRGFLLGRRPCKPSCCSVWRMVWALSSWPFTSATSKAMLAALKRLFLWSQLLHLTHSTKTNHLWSTLARSVLSGTHLGKPLYDTGHCNSVPGCYWTSYSVGHLCGEQPTNSEILREIFAMRCHVEHPVVSMRELYSNNQIWTALIQDTRICMILSS